MGSLRGWPALVLGLLLSCAPPPCPPADAGGDADAGGMGGEDAGAPEQAALRGAVTRSAAPAAGGVGTLYVALFAEDPVATPSAAPVGVARVEEADMRDASAAILYRIEPIPARDEAYYLSAFLDDDRDADPGAPEPGRGDLVTFEGLGSPQVLLDRGEVFTRDLVLSLRHP